MSSDSKVVKEAAPGGAEKGAVLNLKESMFKPEFILSEELSPQDSPLLASLVELFEDLSKVMEDISENYHDDYVFKRYLQDKWNEVLQNAKTEDQVPPADTATV